MFCLWKEYGGLKNYKSEMILQPYVMQYYRFFFIAGFFCRQFSQLPLPAAVAAIRSNAPAAAGA